jgi:hypothetical protein
MLAPDFGKKCGNPEENAHVSALSIIVEGLISWQTTLQTNPQDHNKRNASNNLNIG